MKVLELCNVVKWDIFLMSALVESCTICQQPIKMEIIVDYYLSRQDLKKMKKKKKKHPKKRRAHV